MPIFMDNPLLRLFEVLLPDFNRWHSVVNLNKNITIAKPGYTKGPRTVLINDCQ